MIAIVGGLVAFAPLSIDMYLPALPAMAVELHSGESAIQLTLTAVLVGLALGQLVAGPLSDALGRRRPLLAGIAAYTAVSLLCALAPSAGILIVLRLGQGLSGAAGIVIARAALRDCFSGAELSRTLSMTMLVSGLAPVLAPFIGGQLLRHTSWRGLFVVLGAGGATMLIATFLGLPETLPADRRRTDGAFDVVIALRRLVRDRVFIGYALAFGLANGAVFAYVAGSPFVLEGIFQVSPQAFGLFFGVNALGILVASQVSARTVPRVGPRPLLLIGLSMSAAGGLALLVAVFTAAGLTAILLSLFLVVSAVGLNLPNATALAMADYRSRAGAASAVIGTLQYGLGGIVAPIVGIAGNTTALPFALVIATCGSLAFLTCITLTRSWPSGAP